MTSSRAPWVAGRLPLLIAEIGGNHEGDFDAASRLCDLAIRSGADYVKFQIYTGDSLVSARESPDRHRHFQRFELSPEQHIALAQRCRDAGVGYCASVWDCAAVEWIDPFLDFYKIGSGDLTAWPVLQGLASRGKPMILSSGLSNLREVVETVAFLREVNPCYQDPESILLLQCTSLYPCEDEDANLRAMDTLGNETGLAVGYSNHTRGSLALLVAAARGARALEFHFTDSRDGKQFRDHAVSLTCDEVRELKEQLARIEVLIGDGLKVPTAREVESGHLTSFRRALYSRRPLRKGEPVQAADLVALRPNQGVDARMLRETIGKRARKDLDAFERLDLE